MTIITINAGSSSLRLAAFAGKSDAARPIAVARFDTHDGRADDLLKNFVSEHALAPVEGVVHRIVHGGATFSGPCLIDSRVEAQLAQLAPLAPLHTAAALEQLQASRTVFGAATPQIAAFDTAFYHDLPALAAHYALPAELVERHSLRRYGFHGLAHQAMWLRWSALHPEQALTGRLISLQLGSGCSITAIRGGKPVDTSMGFTPLEGLMMATRCGDLDPGLVLHLQRQLGMDAAELEDMLNRRSGLLGVSGLSADMRVLLAADTPAARFAVELYCYRVSKYIGAYLAVLGGADAIVFGGGVGENAPAVRARILAAMAWAGIHLDTSVNQSTIGREQCISTADSPVAVWLMPVDEQQLMANQALELLHAV